MIEDAFARRAGRAEALAGGSSTAGEALRFAAGLYRAQARASAAMAMVHGGRALTGRLEEDGPRLAAAWPELLAFASEHGPPALAAEARSRTDDEAAVALSRLLVWWAGDRTTAEDYLSRALLRPYVELLAALRVSPSRLHRPGHCPFCGGAPWIAWRRDEREGGSEGAARRLGCGLCGGDWPVNRVQCPRCGEDTPAKLPVFRVEAYPAARIEACETCHSYVKSIDLTLDERAIPEVDDLLSLGMDLWAGEEGFERIEPGLAGL